MLHTNPLAIGNALMLLVGVTKEHDILVEVFDTMTSLVEIHLAVIMTLCQVSEEH